MPQSLKFIGQGRVAWLELDQRPGTYHDLGGVPQDRSQGWSPFGVTCALAELLRHLDTTDGGGSK